MERKFAHGGNIYEDVPVCGEWMDFSANINPLGISRGVRHAIETEIENIVHYPDPSARALKSAISERYGIPRDRIVLGNGGAELFYVFFHAVRPKRVLLPIPSFSEYERAALSAKAEVVYFPLREEDGFRVNEKNLCGEMRSGDCLILGNPNNPTGQRIKSTVLANIIEEALHRHAFVVVDESFMDFCSDSCDYTVRLMTGKYDNLIVVQSLTKFFAIPGLRLGFAVMKPDLAEKLDATKDPWNVNLLAQAAGVAALCDIDYQESTMDWLKKEREYLFRKLSDIDGIKVYRPSVNFIFLRLRQDWGDAGFFSARMRGKGILIRDCSNYPGLDRSYIRVAVRLRTENEMLLDAFHDIKEETR